MLTIGNGQNRARQFIGLIGHRVSPDPFMQRLAVYLKEHPYWRRAFDLGYWPLVALCTACDAAGAALGTAGSADSFFTYRMPVTVAQRAASLARRAHGTSVTRTASPVTRLHGKRRSVSSAARLS